MAFKSVVPPNTFKQLMDTFAARVNTIESAIGVSMALRKESSVIRLGSILWCKDPGDTPGDFLQQLSLTCLLQGCMRWRRGSRW